MVISPQTVGLSEDQLEATVTVNGSIDDLYEGAESLQLMITSLDSAVRFSSPSPAIAVEIADNNCKQIYMSYHMLILSLHTHTHTHTHL